MTTDQTTDTYRAILARHAVALAEHNRLAAQQDGTYMPTLEETETLGEAAGRVEGLADALAAFPKTRPADPDTITLAYRTTVYVTVDLEAGDVTRVTVDDGSAELDQDRDRSESIDAGEISPEAYDQAADIAEVAVWPSWEVGR